MNENKSQKHCLVILLTLFVMSIFEAAFLLKPLALNQVETMSENIFGIVGRIDSLPHQDVAILFLVFWTWVIFYTLINVVANKHTNKNKEEYTDKEIKILEAKPNTLEIISSVIIRIFAISLILNAFYYQMMFVTFIYNNPIIPTNSDLILIAFVLTAAANIAYLNMRAYRFLAYYLNDLIPFNIIKDIIKLDKRGA